MRPYTTGLTMAKPNRPAEAYDVNAGPAGNDRRAMTHVTYSVTRKTQRVENVKPIKETLDKLNYDALRQNGLANELILDW